MSTFLKEKGSGIKSDNLLELEAKYCGVSIECLKSIQYGDQWGQRIKGFYEDYHASRKKKKRKKAKRLRGNKYVKLWNTQT